MPATIPFTQNVTRWFALCMGLAILSYLIPWHSPLGRDFPVNVFAFVFICAGLIGSVWRPSFNRAISLRQISLATVTWLLLACLLLVQSWLLPIRYPDALIFPIGCLVVVSLVSLVSSNVVYKAKLLNTVFFASFIMAGLTFAIQIMQTQHYQIAWEGWVIARGSSNGGRFDGNFGQANHAAYGFVLALCGVIYQLHQSFGDDTYLPFWARERYPQAFRFGLMLLFVLFTVGLAFTQSRAGLMMMLAVFAVYFGSQALTWRRKLSLIGLSVGLFLLYYVGASWLGSQLAGSANGLGAVSRMAGGQGNRSAMNDRALMMFSDHPVLGVGWNNFMGASVDYAQHFKWPEIADHSHNFVTMILAEMGVVGALCFLPIVWLLVKAVHFRHSAESAIALAFVVASVMYASVEYPLWYFRYLAVFAMFLALIDQCYLTLPTWVNTSVVRYGLASALAVALGVAGFYASVYYQRNYLDYNQFVTHKNHLYSDSNIHYNGAVFGFTPYHERILAMQVPINPVNLERKYALFYDVVDLDSSQFNLLAYAQLLAWQGQTDKAFEMMQASCVMVKDVTDCDNVDTDLKDMVRRDPTTFTPLYQRFAAWRQANPQKTGLIDPKS